MKIITMTPILLSVVLPSLSLADDFYDVEQVVNKLTTLKEAMEPTDRENTCSTLENYDFRKEQYGKNEPKKLPWCDKNMLCKPLYQSDSLLAVYTSNDGGVLYDNAGYLAQGQLLKCQMDQMKRPNKPDFPKFTSQQMSLVLAFDVDIENEVRAAVKEERPIDRELIEGFINKTDRKKIIPPEKRDEFINYLVARRKIEHDSRVAIEKNLPKLTTLKGLSVLDSPSFFDGITLSDKSIALYNGEYKKRMDKGSEILEELKVNYKNYFRERVARGEMTEADAQVLMKRINTLELASPQYAAADCFLPNGYYNPLHHQISICHQMLSYPKETLAMILAHEIGHSIDPCISSKKLVAYKKTAGFKSSLDVPNIGKMINDGNIDPKLYTYRTQETDKTNDYMIDYIQEVEHGFSTMKPEDYKIIDQGYSAKTHPLSKEIACLTTFRSINARDNDIDDVKDMLKQKYDAVKTNLDSEIAIAHYKEQSENPERADYWRYCTLNQNAQVQTGEAYSDFMAGEIAKQRIQSYPADQRREKTYETTAYILASYCEDHTFDKSIKAINKELKKNGCSELAIAPKTFSQKVKALFEPETAHPPSGERMQDIFLANPEIAKNLGCKQSGRYCGE